MLTMPAMTCAILSMVGSQSLPLRHSLKSMVRFPWLFRSLSNARKCTWHEPRLFNFLCRKLFFPFVNKGTINLAPLKGPTLTREQIRSCYFLWGDQILPQVSSKCFESDDTLVYFVKEGSTVEMESRWWKSFPWSKRTVEKKETCLYIYGHTTRLELWQCVRFYETLLLQEAWADSFARLHSLG